MPGYVLVREVISDDYEALHDYFEALQFESLPENDKLR